MSQDPATAFDPAAHTLLIVDDVEENRDLLARRFQRRGFQVLQAESGQAALDRLGQAKVDLVILDIMMPGLTGLDVLLRIREEPGTAELPVIMATARTESRDVVHAFDLGATDYVPKPIDFAILHARVLAALRVARARQRSSSRPPAPGLVLAGRYVLGAKLGEGGFGEVYRATHRELSRTVAVKIMRALHAGSEAAARFRREGMTACRVQHPNALAVLDLDVTDDGIPFLVMELLEGHTLEDELNGQLLSLSRCAAVLAPVCEALEAAHTAGIIHRDIKPANIFVHSGPMGEIPKILDFGIAKLIGGDPQPDQVTRDGSFVGTPTYMAPERFRRGECDGRSDVYALAVVLHQALTGNLPYAGSNSMAHPDAMAVAVMHMLDPAIPLRELRPDLPAELERLILAGLSKAPEERPSAAAMAKELRSLAARWGASERPPHLLRRSIRLAPTLCAEQPDITFTRGVAKPKKDAGEG